MPTQATLARTKHQLTLCKSTLGIGRELIRLQTSIAKSGKVAVEQNLLLQYLIAQTKQQWNTFRTNKDECRSQEEIADALRMTLTWATLATELTSHFPHAIGKVHYSGAKPSSQETVFISLVLAGEDSLLHLLRQLWHELAICRPGWMMDAEDRHKIGPRRCYAQQALRVTNLALSICKPVNARWQLPETSDWLSHQTTARGQMGAATQIIRVRAA